MSLVDFLIMVVNNSKKFYTIFEFFYSTIYKQLLVAKE